MLESLAIGMGRVDEFNEHFSVRIVNYSDKMLSYNRQYRIFWRCNLCHATFVAGAAYHVAGHTTHDYKCVCGVDCRSAHETIIHFQLAHFCKMFACMECSYETQNCWEIMQHVINHARRG